LLRSDDGAQEPSDPANDYNYPDRAYYYVETDDQEWIGGSQAGGLHLFDLELLFVFAF
jgi:hypothetical protein